MARLSEQYLMQQVESIVILFHEHTGTEITRGDPSDGTELRVMREEIREAIELTSEEKETAIFWLGFFYARAVGGSRG